MVLLAVGGLSGIATLALTAVVLTVVCAAETLRPAAARPA